MADSPHLPSELEPDQHEHGLATGDITELAAAITRAWLVFEEGVRTDVDLSAESRKQGWSGRDLVARLGEWEFGRTIQDMLADAHDGDADFYDADDLDEHVRARTADLPDEEVLESISRARRTTDNRADQRQGVADVCADDGGLLVQLLCKIDAADDADIGSRAFQ